MGILNYLLEINLKYTRVNRLSADLVRKTIQGILHNNYTPEFTKEPYALKFFTACLENAVDDEIVITGFNKCALNQLSQLKAKNQKDVDHILKITIDFWKLYGDIDKKLYESVRPYIISSLKSSDSTIYTLNSMIVGLSIAGLKDDEVWDLLFERLRKLHVIKFYFFQKRVLHIALKYIE